MSKPELEKLYPEEKKYSLVKLDFWKVPGEDDAGYKMKEFDDLDDGLSFLKDSDREHKGYYPGQGEFVVYDEDGNVVDYRDKI